jgi:c-di-GMP-binding flagellar brake protein YcgR
MNKIPERRKYVRIEKSYFTSFRVKPNDDIVSKDWDTAALVNMSAGGIFFYSRANLEVGTILDLIIGFSRSYPNLKCVGIVIRVTNHQVTSVNGYAVEFTEIDEQIRKMINKNLKSQNYIKS